MSLTSSSDIVSHLLSSNKKWAEYVSSTKSTFFETSSKGQAPKVLWIGCSDSRVPESVITACEPGEIFVHRNIANQFHPNESSATSVLEYAVEYVGVQHIIVAGHTACGGALTCFEGACGRLPINPDSTLAKWLDPLIETAKKLEVEKASTAEEKAQSLSELIEENVKVQVTNLAQSDVIREAWGAGKTIQIHGWVYALDTGLLQDLGITRGPPKN